MTHCDVLLFGEYFCDVIITGMEALPRLGAESYGKGMEIVPGGAYIPATALHRLGVRALWTARLGNDLFSRFVSEAAQKEGLDTSLFQYFDRPLRSMSVSFSFAHDRGFISYIDPFPEDDRAGELVAAQRPHWVYNAPFDGTQASRDFASLVHRAGGRVYTDCQYVTITLDEPGLTDTLRSIDVFAPNQSEACQLTGENNPEKAAALLAEFCPLVVVKCGADGAYARSGKDCWHSPALEVPVVDTTGAGDAFNAGFLAGMLKGKPVETCLRYGNICGGLSTTQCGGTGGAPTLEQLRKYL